MMNYLIKIFTVVAFSGLIIINYYFGAETKGEHIENFTGYLKYVIPLLFIYVPYKVITIFSGNDTVKFTPVRILGLFLLQLIIVSTLFFSYNEQTFSVALGNGLNLFLKIIFFSVLPISIMLISIAFGTRFLGIFLSSYKEKSVNYKFITSSGVGFFLFIFSLTILGMSGVYNLYAVFGILIIFTITAYKELFTLISGFFNHRIELKNHDISSKKILKNINPKLLSIEFLFIIITLILSINLISIIRPFPIGWDDLGAYMNYPQLMSNAGYIGELGSMMSWQTFTGIGYMFNNPTQAFFLNNVGGIMSVIIIILIISEIFKKYKSTFIHLPLLGATLFISMPMIIFQQAKDMKLDSGLFFISIIPLYLLFEFYLGYEKKKKEKKLLSKIETLKIFFVVGLLLGFTFTIKVTSLLLISAIFGVLFYTRLGILGFFGYLSLYFAIFTAGGLWGIMNVVGLDNQEIKTNVSMIGCILGVIFLISARVVHKKKFRRFIPRIIALSIGIIIAILPWGIYNLVSSLKASENIGITSLISGSAELFDVDYSKIHSENELKKLQENIGGRGLTSSGTTTNEDWGRYFGYEKGINNYVKLPWNLTMQNNQGGEFTTIGFLFLALLPVVLLFLPFRKKRYILGIFLLLLLEILVFVKFNNNLIPSSNILDIKNEQVNLFLEKNPYVLQNTFFSSNIYQINFDDYISVESIESLIRLNKNDLDYKNKYKETYEILYQKFYGELQDIIINGSQDYNIKLLNSVLLEKDIEYIKELKILHDTYYIFNDRYDALTTKVKNNDIGIQIDKDIIKLWKENRTIKQFFTEIMVGLNLPYGYIIILLLILLPLIFFDITLQKNNISKLFRINLIFTVFYSFLWGISAFGVVWYGMVMYFNFILMIVIGAYYISCYGKDDTEDDKLLKLFGTIMLGGIIFVYICASVIPHSFNNLQGAGYKEYKMGNITVAEAPYLFHSEYFLMLYNMNVDSSKIKLLINDSMVSEQLIAIVDENNLSNNILGIKQLLKQIINDKKLSDSGLKNSAYISLQNLYKNISHPKNEYKNTSGIYRIGTFLKYHISENNKRLLEDSLIIKFETYIYDKNVDIAVERIKKLGINYFLVDLNAATIDKDPRHALTERYEKLLSTFTSSKFNLIETDSICLKLALEKYRKDGNMKEYLDLAGVNYHGYTSDNKRINKVSKKMSCYKEIISIIDGGKVSDTSYGYLRLYMPYFSKPRTYDEKILFLQKYVGNGSKVLFKIQE